MTLNDYSTLIYFWFGHPQPEYIPEILRDLDQGQWLHTDGQRAGACGVVIGLVMKHPAEMLDWESKYPNLYRINRQRRDRGTSCGERADYLIGYWMITRDENVIDLLRDVCNIPGEVGQYARRQVDGFAFRSLPFRKCWNAAESTRVIL